MALHSGILSGGAQGNLYGVGDGARVYCMQGQPQALHTISPSPKHYASYAVINCLTFFPFFFFLITSDGALGLLLGLRLGVIHS